ncbi:MAG TPA: helix-turn-helix domain-containing protein [Jatrophihabitantaceae bacterium]|nr:helix-turn-helix domain-containing protein [Jatrophihabitantaceae bacterium]
MAGAAAPLRADAQRNRTRVLEAAERLFAERGVADVSMDDVVAAAGVGKGTLYRSFGDKAGLAAALLDERERDIQGEMLDGSDADRDPAERAVQFVQRYFDYVADHLDLVEMSQASGGRHRIGSHQVWQLHLSWLLRDAGVPLAEADIRAGVLLAALSAEQIRHWLETDGRARADVRAALSDLTETLAQTT